MLDLSLLLANSTIYNRVPQLVVTGIAIDSRKIKKGFLFVPLVGTKNDGHSYIIDAVNNGAVASLWQKNIPIPQNINIPLITVDDPLSTLQKMAQEFRRSVNPIVIGITGSNGKTTTKDFIASVLAQKFRVHKTSGNYNNQIGLPLTILEMPIDTEVLVLEMGMSSFGEIKNLAILSNLDIAVITNIGEAHLEYLGSRENIGLAKWEITAGLKKDGLLILNGDEPILRNISQDSDYNIVWFGKNMNNNYYPEEIKISKNLLTKFKINEYPEEFSIPILGEHNVLNALTAFIIGKHFALPNESIINGLSSAKLTGMRSEVVVGKYGETIIFDAYNASPTSMKASLNLLKNLDHYKKRIAFLADMLELGENALEYHKEIGELIAKIKIDYLFLTGELSEEIGKRAIQLGFPKENVFYEKNRNLLVKTLLSYLDKDTVILFKGSRGMKMEELLHLILDSEGE